MDRVNVGDFGGADHGRDVQITVSRARRANADGFVGKTYVQRIAVSLAVNGHAANTQLFARADDAQGNFTAIGNQDLLEHSSDGGNCPATHNRQLRKSYT